MKNKITARQLGKKIEKCLSRKGIKSTVGYAGSGQTFKTKLANQRLREERRIEGEGGHWLL